ncbi:DNA mismatch repair protein MutS [Luteolibacter sp. GHJ8]|uniref:DNA mismatch repair protein MutS n=1 Tax=Luteolibacter rhizosphaerae TaxID=2989719 RepID=A0ABT3G595_9BACT|nr:DNA mismatch repair protein MutS [Luteolibacter rhizosphaerae]MCW1914739.1 DNA mismatch repair protein MutS [Luteolibacter rhizosphaerae]
MSAPTLTPMMAQYQAMRRSLPDDVLLLYRLGDFYEMFFEDAKNAAPILNVALTKRNAIPMCGVPYHAADNYIARLVRAGKRVAIAEQTSEPKPGKIVEREITRIISAGSVVESNLLDDQRPNYLAAVFILGKLRGLACVDHSTGEFTVAEFTDQAQLDDELARLTPSELLISDEQIAHFGALPASQPYDGYAFLPDPARQMLCDHFGVHSLDGYGCADAHSAVAAAGAILHYLVHQLRRPCEHMRSLRMRENGRHVLIDAASQRNLDLIDSRSGKKHTLLGALDRTKTPMGARLLRDWILHPLRDQEVLSARHDFIGSLVAQPFILSKCRESLQGIRDIERTVGRLSQGAGNARDLQSLAISLDNIPSLLDDLSSLSDSRFAIGNPESLQTFPELVELLQSSLAEEPPANLKDGGMIRDGHSPELDELRSLSRDGKSWIAKLQEDERKRTGIDSLKVKFNNVFGYFIEITSSKLAKVPDDYTRKQTMANCERYITPALKEMENKVLGAEERAKQLEQELFLQLRQQVCTRLVELQRTAAAIAEIDVLCGLAETAQLHGHVRPVLEESRGLLISNGRHPVLEQTLVEEKFVPNDTTFDPVDSLLQILTGPNMAGKSTYIRQVALVTLMAQIGAFVPAESAVVGMVDRIFCRVGASDDLSRGQSTFMVEMNETALILNHATEKSLVILDEIGRGTATFDGLSIAWAVAEHLHDIIGCRTLFATHYHELTDLANTRAAVANFNVAVREWNDEIIFLRKILPGAADKSYGIQVARLAGLPKPIIDRAKAILSHLELHSTKPDAKKQGPKAKNTRQPTMPEPNPPQMDLFGEM